MVDQSDNVSQQETWWPVVYQELRSLAAGYMTAERAGHTLQTTGLVHEVYLRLAKQVPVAKWSSRGYFLAVASELMRRILVEHARKRLAQKRGGGVRQRILVDVAGPVPLAPADLLAVHEALDQLVEESPLVAEVVRLRIFGGLSLDDIAEANGIARSTAHRRWSYGKARLWALMKDTDGGDWHEESWDSDAVAAPIEAGNADAMIEDGQR
jgi:RNA polymerase sigma factor (TIGR02999 family)